MQSLDSITSKINGIVQVVSTVVLLFTGFLASICTLVVWTGVNAFINSDKKRNGLMLCFGLSKIQCYRMTALEWLITAFIANVGALSGSYVVVHLIYKYNLGVQYSTDPMQMGAVLLEGILALASFGFILSYSSFNVKPVDLLKDMEGEHPTSKAISPKRFKQIIFNFKRFQKLVK